MAKGGTGGGAVIAPWKPRPRPQPISGGGNSITDAFAGGMLDAGGGGTGGNDMMSGVSSNRENINLLQTDVADLQSQVGVNSTRPAGKGGSKSNKLRMFGPMAQGGR